MQNWRTTYWNLFNALGRVVGVCFALVGLGFAGSEFYNVEAMAAYLPGISPAPSPNPHVEYSGVWRCP